MASLPHCAQGLGAEQGAAQVCRCCAAGATRSTRLPLQHRSRQNTGSEKKCSKSLRLQGCPQSRFPPATSRARDSGLGPQAVVIYLPGSMAKARVTCCIRGVLHLLGNQLCSTLPAAAGSGLGLHAAGSSPPSPAPCQRNAHRRWEEQGRGCFEIPAPVLFIWIPQCPWHSSHS